MAVTGSFARESRDLASRRPGKTPTAASVFDLARDPIHGPLSKRPEAAPSVVPQRAKWPDSVQVVDFQVIHDSAADYGPYCKVPL